MDALGGAGARLAEGAAPGAVDPGQAEDVDRQAAAPPQLQPGTLGGHPVRRARAGRLQNRVLVDPAPGPVAIDPGGRKITGPGEVRAGRDVGPVPIQDRVAGRVRRYAGAQVRGPGECHRRRAQRPIAVEQRDLEALGPERGRGFRVPGGPGDPPAARAQPPGENPGAVAEAEDEKPGHGVARHDRIWIRIADQGAGRLRARAGAVNLGTRTAQN